MNPDRNNRIHLLVLPSILVCLLGLSCSEKPGPVDTSEIRIGIIVTTGDARADIPNRNIVDMVKTRIENDGGLDVCGKKLPVSFIVREIEGGIAEQAVRVVKELINQERVAAIVGPQFSADAIPAGEVAEQSGIPLVTPSSNHPQTTAGRKYVFRASFLNDFQAKAMARFCTRDLGAGKVAVLYNEANFYSRDLAETFRDTIVEEKGVITSFESYVTGRTDFALPLKRIRNNTPDVLYLPNFNEETEPIVIQARDMGVDALLLGIVTWNNERFKEMPQFEGSYKIAYLSPDVMTGEPRALAEEYRSRYGFWPLDEVLLTYDAIGILLAAIQHAGSYEPDAIRDALYDLGPYEGVAGKIDFVNSGDPEREAVIVRFVSGELKFQKRIFPWDEKGTKSQGER